jgi:hypothetical protein
MKKNALLTLFLATLSLTAFSQIGLGIKAGANFPNIDFEDIDSDSKTGLHFGAFANIPLGETFAIQPELFYSSIGAEFDGFDDIDIDYFCVPILLQINLSALNFYAGPQMGFITNVSGADEDDFKSMDWSMVLGAGIDLPLSLEFGGRYVYSVSDISDVADAGEVKAHLWQLYLAWKLFGGKE